MFDEPSKEQLTRWHNEMTIALLKTLLARNKEIPEHIALFALLSLALSSLEASNMGEEAKKEFFDLAKKQGNHMFETAWEKLLFPEQP